MQLTELTSRRRPDQDTGIPHFIMLCFISLHRYCIFYNAAWHLWQTCFEQIYRYHSPNSIYSLHVFVSHFSNSHNISNFFIIIIFVMVICDQWPLILLLWLTEGSGGCWHFFSNKVYLIAHLDYIIIYNFYMHWETKKIHVTHFIAIFALLWWSGIEPKVFLRYACI